jgi:hypothetical protein
MVRRSNEGNDAVVNREGASKNSQDEESFARPAAWKHREQALQSRTFPEYGRYQQIARCNISQMEGVGSHPFESTIAR